MLMAQNDANFKRNTFDLSCHLMAILLTRMNGGTALKTMWTEIKVLKIREQNQNNPQIRV